MKIEDIYCDLPVLETPRLLLRKLTLDDLDSMFEYASNDVVTRFLTWETHKTKDVTLQFISYVLKKYENQEVAPWAIELKENQKFIGTIDFVWWCFWQLKNV